VTASLHDPFHRIRRINALSAQEMYEACTREWQKADLAVLSAAVADFAPEQTAAEKIKKQPGQTAMSLSLSLTPDIARTLGETKRADQKLVGFALESEHEKENALRKLERKNLDAIVLNSLRDKGAGFGTDTNIVTILQADGTATALPLQSKELISEGILTVLFS
jgi:phosphopantothenoylcysteine decarboxylase/phosphopantothenate--cysteine ligase